MRTKIVYLLVILALLIPSVALADAPPYQFSSEAYSGGTPVYHHYYGWQMGNYFVNSSLHTLKYATGDSIVDTHFATAHSRWGGHLRRWMKLQKVSSGYDLYVTSAACPEGPNVIGCYRGLETIYYWYMDAEYAKKINIHLRHTIVQNSTGRDSVMIHEFGHLFALGERYEVNPGGCYAPESSVMDAHTSSGNNYYPCDNIYWPSSVDGSRVTTYWTNGSLNPKLYSGSGFNLKVSGDRIYHQWSDYSWSELHVKLYFYQLESSGWVQYNQWWMDQWLHGGHAATDNRSTEDYFIPTDWGGSHGKFHKVCTQPTYGYNTGSSSSLQHGKLKCSGGIWYP